MERICVAVRVRPPVSEEEISRAFWKIDDNHISLHRPLGTPISGVSYTFDHVFDPTCTNARVYELLPKDIICAAVEGFNGTVFAYGQTSSGKTFTMNGSEYDPGIIHRAVKDVFDKIKKMNQREFLIRVSYMEIYNEEINDLLVLDNQKLQIHESLDRGIFVAGLREEIVSNAEQVMKILEAGEVNRHFGETNMNVRSSRSHTIFRMVIESKGKEKDISSSIDFSSSDAIRVSTLNLVDLAGSERIAKTGAGGVRLKEGKYINKSLMILGNVINKLSDGSKQRGHIPYRDSKLTRILQSALGGNAKTSIICTVAPEEVHIEETKGTLQFANRAKRITNCVQVNEILTDAALLKRQNIEIQELREKLQGSRAEVLEQEILKLRNEMLKFELEKEKLSMELEEERRLHRQRDQCIKEQQIKIENLSNLVNISGDQKPRFENHDVKTLSNTMNSHGLDMFENDAFSTPSFRAAPGSFVARRGNYTSTTDLSDSPLPDSFTNVVDEDTWAKMNKGYVADLDSINMTPAVKSQSFQSTMMSPEITDEHYKQEIEDLRRQLEIVNKEKYDLQREQAEQLDLNKHLQEQMHELKKGAQQHRDVRQQLCESLTTCKDTYNDIVSIMKSSVADEKSVAAKLLSSTSEIGADLLSALESHLTTIVENRGHFNTVPVLALAEGESKEGKEITSSQPNSDHKGADIGEKTAHWKENLWAELNRIKDNHICLLRDLDLGNQASIEKFDEVESEVLSLKEERETLLQRVSDISGKLALVSDQRDMILRKYNSEVQRRKNVEAEIKVVSDGSVSLQRSFDSFHYDFKSKISSLRAQNPIGC